MGRARECVPQLEQAIRLKPSDTDAQFNLALAYEQLNEPEKELPELARLDAAARAAKHPLSASVSAMYARALAATHQLPAAVERMQQAVAADPGNAALLDNLGSLCALQADWPPAERSFRAAIAVDPTLAAAHLHLGLALEAQQNPAAAREPNPDRNAEALAELNAAHRLDPGNPITDLELGRVLALAGDDPHAIPLLRQASAALPPATDAAYQLALALQRSSQLADALPLFAQSAGAQPANPEILTNYGLALCQQQKAAEAVPILQKAAALAPRNPTALENLAAAYIQLSQFDDAVTQLTAALRLAPDSPQIHYNLGLAYKMKDDSARAIPELERAERLDPRQSEAPYALGMLYLQAGRYEDAARELNASLTLQPYNGDGWATLGSVDNTLNRLPEAEAALTQAIALQPHQPDPHLTLAEVLIKQQKTDQARAERRLAGDLMRANMNQQRAEVATHSGESLLQAGDLPGATVQFQDALRFDPASSEAHQGLARVYDAQGRTADAAAERAKIPPPHP